MSHGRLARQIDREETIHNTAHLTLHLSRENCSNTLFHLHFRSLCPYKAMALAKQRIQGLGFERKRSSSSTQHQTQLRIDSCLMTSNFCWAG